MRKLIFCLSVLFLASCGNTSAPEKEFKRQPADTVLTTIQYAHSPGSNDYRTVTAQKVFKDTFALVSVDSITQTKQWKRDSFYIIQLIDTMRDNVGIPVKDSTGKVRMKIVNVMLPKSDDPKTDLLLKDFNKVWNK